MGEPDNTREAPAVDDRLVMPDTRAEILRGALLMPPPADEPHGTSHFDLTYVLRAHVAEGYRGAVDMLTRTGHDSDFAPDASVFPAARDPKTGGRQLEELAFEVVGEQWIGVPSEKARELSRRGVRRVFCIVLKSRRALEWSRETDGWSLLAEDSSIEDRCLAMPLPIRALLDGAEADRAAVAALHRRGLLSEVEAQAREQGRERGLEQGLERGRRASVLDLAEMLGLELDASRRGSIEAMGRTDLEALIAHLKRERRWPS